MAVQKYRLLLRAPPASKPSRQSLVCGTMWDPKGNAWTMLIGFILVVLSVWTLVCTRLRSRRAKFLASLDPIKDAHKLVWFTYSVEFPYLSQKGLDFVLFRSFGFPSISKLIYQTNNLVKEPWKRADATDILVKEFVHHHVDSDRGSYALRRMNAIHSQYKIANEEFVYVLCLFVLNPIEFAARFGYRTWTDAEELAAYTVWHDIAVRMGIKDIPKSIAEMREYVEVFEAKNAVYDEKNHLLANRAKHLLLDSFPWFLRPLGYSGMCVLMGERLRRATGFPKQPLVVEYIILGLLKFIAGTCVAMFMPPRPVSMARDRIEVDWSPNPQANPEQLRKLKVNLYKPSVYENGYKLAELGALKPGQIGKSSPGRLLCPFGG